MRNEHLSRPRLGLLKCTANKACGVELRRSYVGYLEVSTDRGLLSLLLENVGQNRLDVILAGLASVLGGC